MDTIETPRLLLRPFEEKDYDDLYEFLSQRKNDQFEAYPDITYENGREHLRYRVSSGDFYAMELKQTGKVIGNIYYGKRDFDAREIGYIVNKNYQRRGYASEALKAVLYWGFAAGLHRAYAECDPRNECSWKLLLKLGFRREALLRQNVWFQKDRSGNPIWQDTYVYAMLPQDHKQQEIDR